MPTKAKKPTQPRKDAKIYYVTSNIFTSANLLEETKELCEKKRATYRKYAPSELLKDKKFKSDCELVRKKEKIIAINKDGEAEQIEIEMTYFDSVEWVHFIRVSEFKDLENFITECDDQGFDVVVKYFNPDEINDHEEKFLAANIGLEVSGDGELFGLLILQDEFLLDEDGDFEEGCGDENCPDCGNQDD